MIEKVPLKSDIFDEKLVETDQEIWDSLVTNHAEMMTTIQYVIDTCVYGKENRTELNLDDLGRRVVAILRVALEPPNEITKAEALHIRKWIVDLIRGDFVKRVGR